MLGLQPPPRLHAPPVHLPPPLQPGWRHLSELPPSSHSSSCHRQPSWEQPSLLHPLQHVHELLAGIEGSQTQGMSHVQVQRLPPISAPVAFPNAAMQCGAALGEAPLMSTPALRSSCSRCMASRSASLLALPVSSRPWRLASARLAARSALRCSLSTARRASSSAAFLADSSSCSNPSLQKKQRCSAGSMQSSSSPTRGTRLCRGMSQGPEREAGHAPQHGARLPSAQPPQPRAPGAPGPPACAARPPTPSCRPSWARALPPAPHPPLPAHLPWRPRTSSPFLWPSSSASSLLPRSVPAGGVRIQDSKHHFTESAASRTLGMPKTSISCKELTAVFSASSAGGSVGTLSAEAGAAVESMEPGACAG